MRHHGLLGRGVESWRDHPHPGAPSHVSISAAAGPARLWSPVAGSAGRRGGTRAAVGDGHGGDLQPLLTTGVWHMSVAPAPALAATGAPSTESGEPSPPGV